MSAQPQPTPNDDDEACCLELVEESRTWEALPIVAKSPAPEPRQPAVRESASRVNRSVTTRFDLD